MTARLIMKMNVLGVVRETERVSVFTFRHSKREHLPAPRPGAHVDLHLPDGKVRQYSLCGDPQDDTSYRIAVKRHLLGRGGSTWIHENLRVGSVVHVSAPRNNFPLSNEASRHIFVAGGIGVTPIVGMVKAVRRGGRDFMLHYCVRSVRDAPFLDELRELCGPDRLRLSISEDPLSRRFDATSVLGRGAEMSTHVYCCGPPRLLEDVRAATRFWPPGAVHFEAFEARLDDGFVSEPCFVTIASTGQTLHVPANRSVLEVLRDHGLRLPSSCEAGICGSCVCAYLRGTVIHRDSVLSGPERQSRMLLCVSRGRGAVTLDL